MVTKFRDSSLNFPQGELAYYNDQTRSCVYLQSRKVYFLQVIIDTSAIISISNIVQFYSTDAKASLLLIQILIRMHRLRE